MRYACITTVFIFKIWTFGFGRRRISNPARFDRPITSSGNDGRIFHRQSSREFHSVHTGCGSLRSTLCRGAPCSLSVGKTGLSNNRFAKGYRISWRDRRGTRFWRTRSVEKKRNRPWKVSNSTIFFPYKYIVHNLYIRIFVCSFVRIFIAYSTKNTENYSAIPKKKKKLCRKI